MIRLTRKRKIIFAAIAAVILLIVGSIVFGVFNKEKPVKKETPQPEYSLLTGQEVSYEVSERPLLGVMIENSEQARPQTGLDSAGIVFETTTEGGITRFLALYQENIPEIVGPVRSLRTHYLDWVMGFQASIAHVGGSAEALEQSDNRKANSLSQFKYEGPYFREKSREAPHDMYARTKDLQELQKKLGHKKALFEAFPRTSPSPGQTPVAPKISIDFSTPEFLVEFRYEASTNSYTRYLAGSPHIDSASNKPINVTNLIVIKTSVQDSTVSAVGSGEALVFKDGKAINAKWQKASYEERIKITDKEGVEVALNRGDSWFSVVGTDRTISY